MLNLEKCKKVLQQNGKNYTDEEVKQIRDLLYKMGNLDYLMFNHLKTIQDEKCNHIHKGIN